MDERAPKLPQLIRPLSINIRHRSVLGRADALGSTCKVDGMLLMRLDGQTITAAASSRVLRTVKRRLEADILARGWNG